MFILTLKDGEEEGAYAVETKDGDKVLQIFENSDDAEGSDASHGEPTYVIKSPDHRKFGLSPIPDKVYNVHFYAFSKPTSLSAYNDSIAMPEQYSNVITARTRYYVHQFKENIQQAAFALDEYKKNMRV